jgi:hypothetical protein
MEPASKGPRFSPYFATLRLFHTVKLLLSDILRANIRLTADPSMKCQCAGELVGNSGILVSCHEDALRTARGTSGR